MNMDSLKMEQDRKWLAHSATIEKLILTKAEFYWCYPLTDDNGTNIGKVNGIQIQITKNNIL